MNWLAFAVSLVGALCVMLLWQAVDSWLYRRATRLERIVCSTLLLVAIAVPGLWLLPYQSNGVLWGAVTGLLVSGVIDATRRQRMKHVRT